MRHLTRPSDDFLFYEDEELEQFLEKATATTAANFISTNKRIIKHSIVAAKKQAITHTKNILHWLKPIKDGGLERIQKWKRNKLVHDAYSKKKKLFVVCRYRRLVGKVDLLRVPSFKAKASRDKLDINHPYAVLKASVHVAESAVVIFS